MNSSLLNSSVITAPGSGELSGALSKLSAVFKPSKLEEPSASSDKLAVTELNQPSHIDVGLDPGLAAMAACEMNRDGVLLISETGIVEYANSSAARLLSQSRQSIVGQPLVGGTLDNKLAPPALVASWLSGDRCFNLRRSNSATPSAEIGPNANCENKTLQLFYDVFATNNNHLPHRHLITIRDVSEQSNRRNVWKQQAHTDGLTGLPNRRSFVDHLQRKLIENDGRDQFAVVFIDLNRFKPINDNYGHHIGDEMLRVVANRLKKSAGEPHFCARLSGDEFAVILDGAHDEQSAQEGVRQIDGFLCGSVDIQGVELEISVSAGFGLRNNDQNTVESLLAAADAAMYRCKRAGRDDRRTTRTAS